MSRPSVLLVGHDASRTGAPIMLRSLLGWARDHSGAALSVVLGDGGPLVADYESLAPTRVLGGRVATTVRQVDAALRSVNAGVGVPAALADGRPVRTRADVVVANTLSSLPTAARLAARAGAGARLVCWVHELDGVADRVLPTDPAGRAGLLDRVDAFVAVGDAVAQMLVERDRVPRARVTSVPEFIERPDGASIDVDAGRRLLGVEPGRPTILCTGALNRRKGPERFIDLMSVLSDGSPRPQGRWLGGSAAGPVHDEVLAGIEGAAGVSVGFVPSVSDPLSCAAAADVVVSTAIEDPFPLVMLEAGALGVPVVGYDSGGLGQLMRSAGLARMAVPVGDLFGLAEVVRELLADPRRRDRAGADLRARVLGHHLVEQLAPRVWEVIAP